MTSSSEPRRDVPPPPAQGPTYARFIPREELSGFAAWTPGRLRRRRRPRTRAGRPPSAQRRRRAAGRAARSAPGGLPGRLPRRPGRAGELQAEPSRSQMTAQLGAAGAALRRRSSTRCEQQMADSAGARPPRSWRARSCAANWRRGPSWWRRSPAKRSNAVLLSARHITRARAPRRPCRWWRRAPARRWPRAARACSPTPASRAAAACVESDLGAIDARIADALGRRPRPRSASDAAAGADDRPRPATPHDRRSPRSRSPHAPALAALPGRPARPIAAMPLPLETAGHAGARGRPGARSRRHARAGRLGVRGAHAAGQPPVLAEVVGFDGDRAFLMPTGDVHGLASGARVVPRPAPAVPPRLGARQPPLAAQRRPRPAPAGRRRPARPRGRRARRADGPHGPARAACTPSR